MTDRQSFYYFRVIIISLFHIIFRRHQKLQKYGSAININNYKKHNNLIYVNVVFYKKEKPYFFKIRYALFTRTFVFFIKNTNKKRAGKLEVRKRGGAVKLYYIIRLKATKNESAAIRILGSL